MLLTDDSVLENEEDFRGLLTLSPVGGGRVAIGTMDTATAIIEDDDSECKFECYHLLRNYQHLRDLM